jgi:hypothetical protein
MPGAFDGADKDTTYQYTVRATGEDVFNYYSTEMSKLGFFPMQGSPPDGDFFLLFQKPGLTVPMNIKRHGATTGVELLSPRKSS